MDVPRPVGNVTLTLSDVLAKYNTLTLADMEKIRMENTNGIVVNNVGD
jgi:hypothetical protein